MGELIPGTRESSMKFKADKPVVEQKERKEMEKLGTEELYERLLKAFGGISMDLDIVGSAIATQIEDGELKNLSNGDCIKFVEEMTRFSMDRQKRLSKRETDGKKTYSYNYESAFLTIIHAMKKIAAWDSNYEKVYGRKDNKLNNVIQQMDSVDRKKLAEYSDKIS